MRHTGRLILAFIIAVIALISYYANTELNPITGEKQRVALSPRDEIALGLRAAPEMMREYGGEEKDPLLNARVDGVGMRLVQKSTARKADWRYDFHLLADRQTINAFALPGGQIFITRGLLSQLRTEGQVAGVLAHEIGHVLARHGAEHLAKQQLTQQLSGAAGVAAGDMQAAQMAMMVGQLVNMKYGRADEIESDLLGVRLMAESGYDPRAMIEVMKILARSHEGAAPPEFFSTHPNPDNRVARIEEAIQQAFPQGVPDNLER